MQPIKFDRTDLRILAFLQDNGRASNLELAQAVNLSPSQCHRRHRRLEQLGAITRYDARLDAGKIGSNLFLASAAFMPNRMAIAVFAPIPSFGSGVVRAIFFA